MQSHVGQCLYLKTSLPSDCHCDEEGARYLRLAKYSFGLFVFELVCGLITNSMALVSDALHVLVDGSESIVSYGASKAVRRYGNEEKIRRMAGYASGALLILAAFSILSEGVGRLLYPEEVSGWMILFAAIGLGVNLKQMAIHRAAPDEHRNLTHWWQNRHLLSDTLASFGVVVGGAVILVTGWMIVDPILSIVIGLRIIWMIGGRLGKGVEGHTHTVHNDHHHHHHH